MTSPTGPYYLVPIAHALGDRRPVHARRARRGRRDHEGRFGPGGRWHAPAV